MEREASAYLAGDVETLSRLVAHNVKIKAAVVASDPFEKGERAHLNLGHTFGHAFEKATNYAMSHGEAVAVGIVCACRVATDLGLIGSKQAHRVEERCSLPAACRPAAWRRGLMTSCR